MRREARRISLGGSRGIDFALLLPSEGDLVTRTIRQRGCWDPQTTNFSLAYLRQGDHVLDAGAHVGYFSLLFSRLVGPNGTVCAVEPDPENYALLRRNIVLNEARNIEPFQIGLGARRGRANLVRSVGNSGDVTLTAPSLRGHPHVRIATADSVLASAEPLDLVKIDVQGHEDQALAGMGAIVVSGRDRLVGVIEYHTRRLDPDRLSRHLAWLDRFDAQLWAFERWPPGRLHLRRMSLVALNNQMRGTSPIDEDFSLVITFSDIAMDRLARRVEAIGTELRLLN